MEHTDAERRPSKARSRLLGTAARLFYAEGIHSVGIDRIVAEAQVTRATLYRHFPSKDDLILAYLTEASASERARTENAVAGGAPAADALRAISRSIAAVIRDADFRGCAFLNAAAEYPDPEHPVNQAVVAHRQWFLDVITGLLARIRVEPAEHAARHYVMMRDGAMAAGCLYDPELVCETFLRGTDGLLQAHAKEQTGKRTPKKS
ncbi:TetR family transcriptional regulator [Kribbella yunnanensis]|uniref:TetR family transcriptional regulator n=1 Tax=Kribbella yunnanensis TaxID=190194 RepID=A0ABP4UYU1_9ACTN